MLCVNAGSSSLKAAGFDTAPPDDPRQVFAHEVERIAVDEHRQDAYIDAFDDVVRACERAGFEPDVIAHRFVHGGPHLADHTVINNNVRIELRQAVPFAPLHLPTELAVLDAAGTRYRGCVHVACLDTAFHRGLSATARRLPIPARFDAAGVRRYGFHGVSYEYLVHRLGTRLGTRAVLAHLGNGSSLAAVRDGVGIDTTMGLTPTGGLVMATRTGDLDPGVIIHLLRNDELDADRIERLVDFESGLLALSGRSGDMREILAACKEGDEHAALALDIYETVSAKNIGALVTVLGGLDTIVFTAGIGERAAPIRANICNRLNHLGVAIDEAANQEDAEIISSSESSVTVRVEPTNEELVMALHARRLLADVS